MYKTQTPATQAYHRLVELAQFDRVRDAHTFALAWLAAGRMVAQGMVDGVLTVDQLAGTQTMKALTDAGFPLEAASIITGGSARAQEIGRRAQAADIVSGLTKELGIHRWDILQCLNEANGRYGEAAGTVIPELASLLMDMVGAPPDAEVWIPFDMQGQLTVEALRRRWRVLAASPLPAHQLARQLVITIETGQANPATVRNEVRRDAAGRPAETIDYALVTAPLGMLIREGQMTTWDITGTRPYEQYKRSDAWALFEFSNRIQKRGVFLTTQGILFSKGQEQRLREYLLQWASTRNQIKSVIALPAGVFGGTNIGGAIIALECVHDQGGIHMADLDSGRRSIQEAGQIIKDCGPLALGETQALKARKVSHEEIWLNECSFAPSRYLRQVVDLGPNTVKLGDICEAIKPPATSRVPTTYEVVEAGLQDLGQWRPVSHELEKVAFVKSPPKDSALLSPGDLIISIKGSVGRVGLMGQAAAQRPTVVSQSCIALRLSSRGTRELLTAEVLLMYLRSPHGQAQLAGLQVGTGVKHISPATLLSALLVPVPSPNECTEIRHEYARLCELEMQLVETEQNMLELAHHRWPATP